MKIEFFITFKQKSKLKDYYSRVYAKDCKSALKMAEEMFPEQVSMIYEKNEFEHKYCPKGEI